MSYKRATTESFSAVRRAILADGGRIVDIVHNISGNITIAYIPE